MVSGGVSKDLCVIGETQDCLTVQNIALLLLPGCSVSYRGYQGHLKGPCLVSIAHSATEKEG